MLTGGDRRSIGRVDEVVAFAGHSASKIGALVDCLWDEDARVRMRAADALEKISRKQASALQPHQKELMALARTTTQKEVRWHLAVMLPRLRLTQVESERVAEILESYLEDRSSIVKTCAMQGLVELSEQCTSLRPLADEIVRAATRSGTAAMRARGRKLLPKLDA
jgi:HEAT repeat protein